MTQRDLECEHCGSSRGKMIDDKGLAHCFACERTWWDNKDNKGVPMEKEHSKAKPLLFDLTPPKSSIRGISPETLVRWHIGLTSDGTPLFPRFSVATGAIVEQKEHKKTTRYNDKKELAEAGLFGQNLFAPGSSKYVIVTEGEFDALSVSEMCGKTQPVVSIGGATQKLTPIQMKYLNSFDYIVIATDADEPGRKCAHRLARAFGAKARLFNYSDPSKFKDANDYLTQGQTALFHRDWIAAKSNTFKPEGIIASSDTQKFLKREKTQGFPWPFTGLNETLGGIYEGQLITLTGGTGTGKTTWLKKVAHHLWKNQPWINQGCIFLEEPLEDTVDGLLGFHMKSNQMLEEVREETSNEQREEAWNELMADDRFVFWDVSDDANSSSIERIVENIRLMAVMGDAKIIYLDHLSIIFSGQKNAGSAADIDYVMTELAKLARELKIVIVLISHLSRREGKIFEEGAEISLNDLRGSHGIAQLSHVVIGLERNQQAPTDNERNLLRMRVLKSRKTGKTGIAGSIVFNEITCDYYEIRKKQGEATNEPNSDASESDTSSSVQSEASVEEERGFEATSGGPRTESEVSGGSTPAAASSVSPESRELIDKYVRKSNGAGAAYSNHEHGEVTGSSAEVSSNNPPFDKEEAQTTKRRKV